MDRAATVSPSAAMKQMVLTRFSKHLVSWSPDSNQNNQKEIFNTVLRTEQEPRNINLNIELCSCIILFNSRFLCRRGYIKGYLLTFDEDSETSYNLPL